MYLKITSPGVSDLENYPMYPFLHTPNDSNQFVNMTYIDEPWDDEEDDDFDDDFDDEDE